MSHLTRLEYGLVELGPVQNRKVESVLKECNITPFMLVVNRYSEYHRLVRSSLSDCFELIGRPVSRIPSPPRPLGHLSDPGFFLPDCFAQKIDPFAALAVCKFSYDVHVF